jgi:GDP-L-fucose synthase
VGDFDVSGKRVLVTGGWGFLGSAVCLALASSGAKPLRTGSRDFDLTEQSEVRRMYAELEPAAVVHTAAAVGGIGANVANPGKFLYQNALMGLMLLEEGRRAQIEKFVLISTGCTYPEDAPLPMTERAIWSGKPTGATGPYGLAKRLLHEACSTYEQQYQMSLAVLVMANLYGPGDNFSPETGHVIPSIVRRYLEAKQSGAPVVTNWGTGSPTREFLHVRDAARAIIDGLVIDTGASPINIGTGVETSIREVSSIVQRAVGYTGLVRWDDSKPDGQPRRYFDVSVAERILNFRASTALDQGIYETVDWFRNSGAVPDLSLNER